MSGFIYVWVNKINGKKYIGRHTGSETDSYIGSGKYFRRAVKKYGIDSFERKILERVENGDIKEREKYYLDLFEASNSDEYYNISPNSNGGHHGHDLSGDKNPMFGKKHPNHKPHYGPNNGMYGSSRFGELNPMYGKTHRDITKEKISFSTKNQKKHKCIYCGAETNAGNIKRWHNNNCKRIKNESI